MNPKNHRTLSRRSLLGGTAATAAVVLTGQSSAAPLDEVGSPPRKPKKTSFATHRSTVKTYSSGEFYDSEGNFLVEEAREAYFDMFNRFHYPISDKLKEEMWILEFGLGDFANVGMAGIFWLNRKDFGYFGHEIYLLPGQMIPEHCHVETKLGPPKMESWHPRRGMIYTFGEGLPSLDFLPKIPESQRDIVKSRCCTPLKVDELADLKQLKAWHFMVAGSEGALVTEYGTYHDMDGLKFSNPKAKL